MKAVTNTTKDIIVLGILSGMRANAGLFCTSLIVRKQPGVYFSPDKLTQFFNSNKTLTGLSFSSVGELVMDKLPTTPNRIEPGGLGGRMLSGAVCGAAVSKVAGKKQGYGAILGGLAAMASTFAFYYLRKELGKAAKIPDPYLGAAEDALAIAISVALLKRNKI